MLLEIIKFIFCSFWRWVGFFLITIVLVSGIIDLVLFLLLVKAILGGIVDCIAAKTGNWPNTDSEDTNSDESTDTIDE